MGRREYDDRREEPDQSVPIEVIKGSYEDMIEAIHEEDRLEKEKQEKTAEYERRRRKKFVSRRRR
ncbi:MAG: hypothetical protein ABI758_00685 [Candidatus Woesebacteria bacterium]